MAPAVLGLGARRTTGTGTGRYRCLRSHPKLAEWRAAIEHPARGFNRRKMEDRRREAAEKEAASRRATDAQVLEDAERLIAGWNERQAKRMPMLFSPTIGAAVGARYWFFWVRCPACRTINAIDLRTVDHHPTGR